MPYPLFPLVAGLSYPLNEPLYKPKVRSEFENGTVQARTRFTRAKKRFALKWDKIPIEDAAVLETFFETIGADVFIFVHPLTQAKYNCIISDDDFNGTLVECDYYDVNMNIEEI